MMFLSNFELDEIETFGGEKVHILGERFDFACCLLRRKSAHSGSEKVHHSVCMFGFGQPNPDLLAIRSSPLAIRSLCC